MRAGEEHRDPRRPRLRLRHGPRAEPLPARHRRGEDPRPALHRVPARVRAVARRLPALRGADRGGGAGRRQGHGHHLLHRARAVGEPRRSRRPTRASRVLLDGANIPFNHVLQECALEDVRMGMRVQAVWAPKAELGPSMRASATSSRSREPDAAVRLVQGAPVMRDVGDRLVRAVRQRRARLRNEVEILMPVVHEAVKALGPAAHRDRLHLLGLERLPAGPDASRSSARSTRSARGRRSRSRTSRWTAPGRSTRRGSRSRPATSTRRWSTRSASRRRATRRGAGAAARPVHASTPLWPDADSLAALQARAFLEATGVSERELAEVAVRSRRNAIEQPARGGVGRVRASRSCSPSRTSCSPLRAHDCRRSPTARRRW